MKNLFYTLQQQRSLLIILLTNILVPIATNLASSWIENTVARLVVALLGSAVIIVLIMLAYWLLRQKPRQIAPPDLQPERYPGLIVIVGTGRKGEGTRPGDLSHERAIEYHLQGNPHKLVCWLLLTAGPEGSMGELTGLRERYLPRCRDVRYRVIESPMKVQETYNTVLDIYREAQDLFQLAPEQVIADFTGGTKPMSAGMILACGDRWPMQYMYGQRGVIETQPVVVKFSAVESKDQ